MLFLLWMVINMYFFLRMKRLRPSLATSGPKWWDWTDLWHLIDYCSIDYLQQLWCYGTCGSSGKMSSSPGIRSCSVESTQLRYQGRCFGSRIWSSKKSRFWLDHDNDNRVCRFSADQYTDIYMTGNNNTAVFRSETVFLHHVLYFIIL